MKKKVLYLEEFLLILTLIVMVILIFGQVVGRYVFQTSPSWTEELARYIHIWQVWIGASYAIKLRRHLRIEAFVNLLNSFQQKIIETVSVIVWFVLAVFLAVTGSQIVLGSINFGQVTPAMQVPMWIVFLAIPLGSIGMVLRLIEQLWLLWRPSKPEPS
ncbi:TRAP transporter small permease [Salipaludibacillus sp. CF4.18]|uniref:TRAP transporter small permease n=1 Tax=Salipaludibacillus sp. CF4.18 TaxID=3373081 RepID=UPI003EE5705E